MSKLTSSEVESALPTLPGWQLSQGQLVRDFTFPGFPAAISFVNQVAALAESVNHHPDIDIRYDKVRLALISHDSGGITHRDVKFATSVNESFPA